MLLPPVPERLKWGFTPDEKCLAVIRTWQANNTPNATFRWHQLSQTFKSSMFYTYTLFCCTQIAITSLGSFLPATIKGLGYSGVTAQLLTVPVYACAFATTITISFISDKIQRRGLCIALSSTLSLIGYIMLIASDSKSPRTAGTRYAGICLAAAGQFPNANLILAWNAFNTRAFTHRATSSTLIAMIGQAAALAGLQGFDTPPFYVKGNAVVLGVVAVMPPVALGMSWWFGRLNRAKREEEGGREAEEGGKGAWRSWEVIIQILCIRFEWMRGRFGMG